MKIKVKQIIDLEVTVARCEICLENAMRILPGGCGRYQATCPKCEICAPVGRCEYDAVINWNKLMGRLEG